MTVHNMLMAASGSGSGPAINSSGLLLHLDAANTASYPGSGTSWYDVSGNTATPSVLNGGVSYSSAQKAMYFDGSSGYVDLPAAYSAGRSEYTVMLAINSNRLNGTDTIYDEEVSSYPQYWQFCFRQDGLYTRDVSTGLSGSRNNDLLISNGPSGVWKIIHIVYSVSRSVKSIYSDNVMIASSNVSIDQITAERTANTRLGRPIDGSFYNGYISVCALYSRALTDAEISSNYNALRTRYGI